VRLKGRNRESRKLKREMRFGCLGSFGFEGKMFLIIIK